MIDTQISIRFNTVNNEMPLTFAIYVMLSANPYFTENRSK